MKLVIVESPTKAKTIKRYLGKDYVVKSSFGHIRDLPKKEMGIDPEKKFQPKYEIITKSKKALNEIKKTIKDKDIKQIVLATDEDREGEAIAFHLKWIIEQQFPKMKFKRITFHEITKGAIKQALENPRKIDLNLYNAQQARRVLDRLVGYNLSPLLWKKIRYGLSAGRVQSVALRLIVERERERQAFKPKEYWTIAGNFYQKGLKSKVNLNNIEQNKDPDLIQAFLEKINDKKIGKFAIKDKKQAKELEAEIKKADFQVEKIDKKEVKRNPAPAFRTSTLQREAANKLGYSAKQTMRIAQQLYEGIKLDKGSSGLITYMRTDSLNISPMALKKAKKVIGIEYGDEYTLEKPRYYAKKAKGAQEAHEAIRPTYPEKKPEALKKYLNSNQYRLYDLIWRKFIASQMKPAIFDRVKIDIETLNLTKKYIFAAKGQTIKFDGFLKVYEKFETGKENRLPGAQESQKLDLVKLLSERHFTQPPARYSDASLIKVLEENGIGRPSTYAPTLSTIIERGYVDKDENKQYYPLEIGYLVNDLMVEHFQKIVDYQFTATMETNFDKIAQGRKNWQQVIENFYKPFIEKLNKKSTTIKKYQKEIDKKCPECGKKLLEKFGRFGKFFACSGYPECKYTEDPNQKANEAKKKELKKQVGEVKCEKCGANMEIKQGRWGHFLGCSAYPECKNIKKIENSSGVTCPVCGQGEIVEKKSRRGIFWACNNFPKCKTAFNGKPIQEKCKNCGSLLIQDLKSGKKRCSNKKCKQGFKELDK
ncbi:MAG: type I DNA topoisomerase [Candidatus Moranbacteria bacterium]|nr:type I DNA topoisomerase [Candidatus Moranbacteria bacterium]